MDRASRGGNSMPKEVDIALPHMMGRGGFASRQAVEIGLLDWLALGAREPGSEAPGY